MDGRNSKKTERKHRRRNKKNIGEAAGVEMAAAEKKNQRHRRNARKQNDKCAASAWARRRGVGIARKAVVRGHQYRIFLCSGAPPRVTLPLAACACARLPRVFLLRTICHGARCCDIGRGKGIKSGQHEHIAPRGHHGVFFYPPPRTRFQRL